MKSADRLTDIALQQIWRWLKPRLGEAVPTHASSHKHGGGDEVATATPAANAIPKAGADGKLASGWLPALGSGDMEKSTYDSDNDGVVDNSEALGGKDAAALLQGWIAAGVTWTYASATTFTVSGDVRDLFPTGTKIKLTQTTVKYFYVVGVSYSSPNTTVTITGGADYSLANAAITDPTYSYAETPQGFPGWFNFTPVWASVSNPQPALGNGSLKSRFKITGSSLLWMAYYLFGSTTTFGTGNWSFSLPVISANNGQVNSGTGNARDGGVNNYIRQLQIGAAITALSVFVQVDSATNNNVLSSTLPFAWGNGDSLVFQIEYEI